MRLWQHLLKQQDAPAAPAYRYWRIFMEDGNGATILALAEVKWQTYTGGPRVNTNSTPVTASSVNTSGGGQLAVYTTDDNLTTTWISVSGQNTNQWLRYDLLVPAAITHVSMHQQNMEPTRAPKNLRIEGSNDGTTFTVIKSFSATGWTNNWREFPLY